MIIDANFAKLLDRIILESELAARAYRRFLGQPQPSIMLSDLKAYAGSLI